VNEALGLVPGPDDLCLLGGSFPTCLLPDPVNECLDGAAACPLPCKVNNPQGCAAPPCSPTGPPVSCGPYLQGLLSQVIPNCSTGPALPVPAYVCFGIGQGILTRNLGLRAL
ncbi:MAG TPA: hypothetical protein VM327_02535, partial [Candidatus Thermoplasmatota archaeon]|nr:hypothetical protein [Candidatus Thermoplasmatota archaeon]